MHTEGQFTLIHVGEEGRHICFSREGQQVASCRNMQTRTMAAQTGEETTKGKRPSTGRNRDYSVKINWT